MSDLPINLDKVRAFLDGIRERTRRARIALLGQAQSDARAIIELEKVDTETAEGIRRRGRIVHEGKGNR